MKTLSFYKKGISEDFFKNLLSRFKNEDIYLEDLRSKDFYKVLASTYSALIVAKVDKNGEQVNQSYVRFPDRDKVLITSDEKNVFINNGEESYRVSSNILNLRDYFLRTN